jgi:hypothetical protein
VIIINSHYDAAQDDDRCCMEEGASNFSLGDNSRVAMPGAGAMFFQVLFEEFTRLTQNI